MRYVFIHYFYDYNSPSYFLLCFFLFPFSYPPSFHCIFLSAFYFVIFSSLFSSLSFIPDSFFIKTPHSFFLLCPRGISNFLIYYMLLNKSFLLHHSPYADLSYLLVHPQIIFDFHPLAPLIPLNSSPPSRSSSFSHSFHSSPHSSSSPSSSFPLSSSSSVTSGAFKWQWRFLSRYRRGEERIRPNRIREEIRFLGPCRSPYTS